VDWQLKDELQLAEKVIRYWSDAPLERVISGTFKSGKTAYQFAGIAYEAGEFMVEQFLAVSPKGKLYEGAVVVSKKPTTILVDRVILAEPLAEVGAKYVAPLLCEDFLLKKELEQGCMVSTIFERELRRKMEFFQRNPQFLKSKAESARGRGQSIGAVSGGLPTLGKRR
jgi:hypothetical protein